MVVHFPIALTMVSFAAALASQLFKQRVFANQLAIVSHYLLWLAAATAIAAVAFGWLAYNSVNHDDAGHVAMGIHRVWAISTAGLLLLLALWDVKKHLLTTIIPLYFVVLLGVASASVGATAWLGGEVVYRHGIGVLSLPQSEDEAVGHEQGVQEHVPHEHSAHEQGSAAIGHDELKMDMPMPTTPDAQGKVSAEKSLDSSPAISQPATAETEKQADLAKPAKSAIQHADDSHINGENSEHDHQKHHKHQHASE